MVIFIVILCTLIIVGVVVFLVKLNTDGDSDVPEKNDGNNDEEEKIKFEKLFRHNWENHFFRCLGKLAKADDHVDAGESALVKSLFEQLNFENRRRAQMGLEFNSGRDTDKTFEELVLELRNSLLFTKETAELTQIVIKVFCALAVADGELHAEEWKMLKKAGKILGSEDYVDRFYCRLAGTENSENSQTRDEPREDAFSGNEYSAACQILGISEDADIDEITEVYRQKVREFNPVKVRNARLSDAFLEFARERCRIINSAFEIVKRSRGIK